MVLRVILKNGSIVEYNKTQVPPKKILKDLLEMLVKERSAVVWAGEDKASLLFKDKKD